MNRKNTKPRVPPRPATRRSNGNATPTRPQPIKRQSRLSSAAAAAYSTRLGSFEPNVVGSFRKTTIKHRELIASVTGTVAFTVANSFALNPGLAQTFPWLSTQALGWEQYKFNRLKFCYYTRTGTATPGSVLLVPDYDAADSAPLSEQIASAYRDCVEEVPWVESFSCELDPSALQGNVGPTGRHFVRTAPLAANLDIKTYDCGNLHLATVDGTAVPWGKLWVEYDVDLYVPQLPPTGASNFASSLVNSTGTGSTTTAPLGSVSSQVARGPVSISTTGTNVVSFSGLIPGTSYNIQFFTGGTTAATATLNTFVGFTAGNQLSILTASAGNIWGTQSAGTSYTFTATAVSGSINYQLGTLTVPTAAAVILTALPPSFGY